MKRNRSIIAVAVFGFSAFTSVVAVPAPADLAGESPPEGLTAAEWTSIREAHEDWKHRFGENEDGTVSATNPGQQWRTLFDGRGFLSQPRNQDWKWGLELTGYGVGKERHSVAGKATPEVSGTRLSYRRDGILEEWFVNDSRGLEQGWTLGERPTGSDGEGLHLDLAVRGDLRPEVSGEGLGVNFVSENGATALTYGGLKAWDANGRPLPARFVAHGESLTVTVDDRSAAYPVTIDPIAQQAYLKASNTGANDKFGNSVSVSGDTVVVGAPGESSAATGVDGDGTNDDGDHNLSGAAYVFVRSGSTWTQQAYLKASNTGEGDAFGTSVSVSGDTIVVGANDEDSAATGVNGDQNDDDGAHNASGAAYVFTRSGTVWTQQAYLKASDTGENDLFGFSVSVSGNTVVVGAYGQSNVAGAAYVFTRSGSTWSQQAYLKASNAQTSDFFGGSVAISGNTIVVGATREDSAATGVNGDQGNDLAFQQSGAAYVFIRSGTSWSQQAYLKASNTGKDDYFGASVAVSGDTILVGAYGEDSAATGINGDGSNNSAADSGAAYVFTRSGSTWSQQAYLKASNTERIDQFGTSVAISYNTAVVGANLESSAATGINGDQDDDDGAHDRSGAAYVFTRSGESWSQQAYLKASNTGAGDFFGWSVAVSGDTVVVGADYEDSSATGVDGNGSNNSAGGSGATYLFTIPSSSPTLKVTGKKTITTSKSRYSLKGGAADADGDLIRVEARDSRPAGSRKYRSARGTTRWSYQAPLRSGRNVVKIRSVDSTGKLSRITRVNISRR